MCLLREGETAKESIERFTKEREIAENIWCPYCKQKQSQETIYDHVTYWGEPNKDEDEICHCDDCGEKFRVKENVERTFETMKFSTEIAKALVSEGDTNDNQDKG